MEHLRLPSGASLSDEDKVRYVSNERYDRNEFLTYPLRKPILRPIMALGNTSSAIPVVRNYFDQNARLLEDAFQTWLFFGLIYEFVGEELEDLELVDPQRQFINTESLEELIRNWTSTVTVTGEIFRHLVDCLHRVYYLLLATHGTKFDENIRFSIASTAEMLDRALQRAFTEKPLGIAWALGFWTEARTKKMTKLGWCPYEASLLPTKAPSLQTMFFYSRMEKGASLRDHSKCSIDLCEFSQKAKRDVKELSGSTHLSPCVDCNVVAVEDLDIMRDLLAENTIPLIRVEFDPDNNPSLSVVPSSEETRYVAISHVFADGLGNKKENALRTCRLAYLHRLITTLGHIAKDDSSKNSFLLWVDTLCCPLKPIESRRKAIALLRRTYKEAAYVLILDAELQVLKVEEMNVLERSARLLTSSWMLRLWTLQEGALAKYPWVQFADGVENVETLFQSVKEIYKSPSSPVKDRTISRDLITAFQSLREYFTDSSNLTLRLLATATENRLISMPDDEPRCLGTLLDLNVDALDRTPPSERMRLLWNFMASRKEGIPRSIIFHQGEKLDFPGYRWAPSTLRVSLSGFTSFDWPQGVGVPISSGLLVEFPGAVIKALSPPPGIDVARMELPPNLKEDGKVYETFYVRDSSGSWAQLRSDRGDSHDPHPTSTQAQSEELPYLHEMLQADKKKYAIILRDNVVPGKSNQSSTFGLVVEVLRYKEQVTIVKKVRNVILRYQDAAQCLLLNEAVRAGTALRDSQATRNFAEALQVHPGSIQKEPLKSSFQPLQDEILAESGQPVVPVLSILILGALLGRYAVLEPWSNPTKAWSVD